MQTPHEFDKAIADLLGQEGSRPDAHWWTMLAGSKIKGLEFVGYDVDTLKILFEDGQSLQLRDGQRSCCESRYVTCDDDLHEYIGAYLRGIEVSDGPTVEDDEGYHVHEQQFVRIATTLGTIVLCTHNEHNGYYSGFSLAGQWEGPDGSVITSWHFG